MTFLVLLIALVINYLWLRDFDRFDDGWFFRFRKRMEKLTGNREQADSFRWLLSLLLIYGIPVMAVLALLWFVNGRVLDIPTMILHILVLLIALDRTQPGRLASNFLEHWDQGDLQGSLYYLQQELGVPADVVLDDEESVGRYFCKQLNYRCFERMFMMYFWYVFTGPVGVVVAYISYQLRDSLLRDNLSGDSHGVHGAHDEHQPRREVGVVATVIALMEWVPLRLLALTFSLAGNFVRCFERIKQSFWVFDKNFDAAEMLYSYASCALSGTIGSADDEEAVSAGDEEAVEAVASDTSGQTGQESCGEVMASEIGAIQGLLERSQAIWLALVALITIFGLQLP